MEKICSRSIEKRKTYEENDYALEKVLILSHKELFEELDEKCRYRREKNITEK